MNDQSFIYNLNDRITRIGQLLREAQAKESAEVPAQFLKLLMRLSQL